MIRGTVIILEEVTYALELDSYTRVVFEKSRLCISLAKNE
jgi:hypothetical protein